MAHVIFFKKAPIIVSRASILEKDQGSKALPACRAGGGRWEGRAAALSSQRASSHSTTGSKQEGPQETMLVHKEVTEGADKFLGEGKR